MTEPITIWETLPGESDQDALKRRIMALESRGIAIDDLPIAALQNKLELDWLPDVSSAMRLGELAADALPPMPYAKLRHSAAQGIANITVTNLVYDTVDSDDINDMIYTGSQPFLKAHTPGRYAIKARCKWQASGANSLRYLAIAVDGTTRDEDFRPGVTNGQLTSNIAFTTARLARGSTIQAAAYQDTGGGLNVLGGFSECTLEAFWISN